MASTAVSNNCHFVKKAKVFKREVFVMKAKNNVPMANEEFKEPSGIRIFAEFVALLLFAMFLVNSVFAGDDSKPTPEDAANAVYYDYIDTSEDVRTA